MDNMNDRCAAAQGTCRCQLLGLLYATSTDEGGGTRMPHVQHVGWHRAPDVVIVQTVHNCNIWTRVKIARDGGNAGSMVRGLRVVERL